MGLLYNYNSFSLRRTNKHPSSGPNLPLNLFFTEFMFFITLSRHSQKHNFSTFSSKIYSWTSLQFIFSPLNFFHRPVFRPVPRTLGNSHRVSNSHLTFSSVNSTIRVLCQCKDNNSNVTALFQEGYFEGTAW